MKTDNFCTGQIKRVHHAKGWHLGYHGNKRKIFNMILTISSEDHKNIRIDLDRSKAEQVVKVLKNALRLKPIKALK